MFGQILDLVKNQLGGNPEVVSTIPNDKVDAVCNEVAAHINDGLKKPCGGTKRNRRVVIFTYR
ncbi:hypothetical protein [Arcticibacter eurypsychrophilus]|uniref:hypothetical protein n=1 Tax=Arcticibacter eurypsychrophilus TaxID=1434752 RepID=UPI00084D5639|nr:hypothetical protein [Arcticibacter eurypsychrophilus]